MSESADITVNQSEWEDLADADPPVVERDDGSLLVAAGLWSIGKREYAYATLEIAGQKPGSVGPDIARPIHSARGAAVEEFRHDADADYDGTRYRSATEQSRLTVWWIAPEVPVRVKAGQTYTSSGQINYGDAKVHFYGGPASAPAYRSVSQKFQQTHAATLAAPQPPTPRQREVLQRYADRAKAWGLGVYRVPATAVGAKAVLDALAENGWKLRGEYGYGSAPSPLDVWGRVQHQEQPRPEPPAPIPAHATHRSRR